jgi:hypothetical protein
VAHVLSYYIKRTRQIDGVNHVWYWNGKCGWSKDDAKGYSTHKRAENALIRLIKKCETYGDESSIEESRG